MSDSEIVKEFLVESYENLDRLDRDLVGLEKNPQDREALGGVFRTIHTIKGTCGFLGFTKLEKVAHVGENLLSRLRDGDLLLNPEITTALLGMVDAVRQMLKEIESTGKDGDIDYPEVRDMLTRLQQEPEAQEEPEHTIMPKVTKEAGEPLTSIGEILMQRAGVTEEEILRAATIQKDRSTRGAWARFWYEAGAARPADVVEALRIQRSEAAPASASESTVRVNVGLLDKVMTLVGELVLARNQVLQFAGRMKDAGLPGGSQRLNLITTELQEGVMKTRMQPDRKYLGAISADGARRRAGLRQAGEHRNGGQGDRTG